MNQRAYPPAVATTYALASLGGRRLALLRACLTLVKPRIVSLVVFTSVVACYAAADGTPPGPAVLLLTLAGTLAAGGAAALNHYLDRDIDASMERTRRRPLVSGQIGRPGLVPVASLAMIAAGVALAGLINPVVSLFTLLGALVYAGIYTLWLKRRTPLNIVIGGFAGSAAVLGGWAAVEPALGLVPWLLAGLVFTWTPAHFWSLALARRGDYARARVPMLPVLVGPISSAWWIGGHILLTVTLSIGLAVAGGLGLVYAGLAAPAGFGFALAGVALLRRPAATIAWQVFKWSGPYLGLIFLAVLLDTMARLFL